jgi:hypothetical protein
VLISLAGYDMRDVTITDSDATTLIHCPLYLYLQIQRAVADRHTATSGGHQRTRYGELQRTDSPTGGRVQRLQQIT